MAKFFDLPLELRTMVYELYFQASSNHFHDMTVFRAPDNAIRCISKSVFEDTQRAYDRAKPNHATRSDRLPDLCDALLRMSYAEKVEMRRAEGVPSNMDTMTAARVNKILNHPLVPIHDTTMHVVRSPSIMMRRLSIIHSLNNDPCITRLLHDDGSLNALGRLVEAATPKLEDGWERKPCTMARMDHRWWAIELGWQRRVHRRCKIRRRAIRMFEAEYGSKLPDIRDRGKALRRIELKAYGDEVREHGRLEMHFHEHTPWREEWKRRHGQARGKGMV